MSTQRERTVEQLLNTLNWMPTMVVIGRDDDLPTATFENGSGEYVRLTGRGDSDEEAAQDIARQASRHPGLKPSPN